MGGLKELQKAYDLAAGAYEVLRQGPMADYFGEFEDGWILRHARIDGRDLLDLGTGTGRFACAMAPKARSVVGLDVSRGMVQIAKAKTGTNRNLRFLVGSCDDLPFAEASFDVVAAIGLFPHVGNLPPVLAEIRRVLRPGGHLVWTCKNRDRAFWMRRWQMDPTIPKFDYGMEDFERILPRNGFAMVEQTTSFFLPWDVVQRVYAKCASGFSKRAWTGLCMLLGRIAMRIAALEGRGNSILGVAKRTSE